MAMIPKTKKVVFDSNIVIGCANDLQVRTKLNTLLHNAKWYISVITRLEVLSYTNFKQGEEAFIRAFLKRCKVVPLNRKVEKAALTFRRIVKRKLPDSIIAATAIALDAALVTRDADLLSAQTAGLRALSII